MDTKIHTKPGPGGAGRPRPKGAESEASGLAEDRRSDIILIPTPIKKSSKKAKKMNPKMTHRPTSNLNPPLNQK